VHVPTRPDAALPAHLSYIVPHSWALNGYQNLLVRGQGIQEVLPQIGALLGFALLFFLIFAVLRFDFED
jgi:ABC-2 type transport system permease protein